jgi:hypothetical protein
MAVGTTADFTLTRDQLIELGYKLIGVLPPGDTLDGELLEDAKKVLGLVVRETDSSGNWRWTIDVASTLTLVANTFRYTSSNGLPTNMADLVKVMYRDSQASDHPVKILKAEGYEAVERKIQTGDPEAVYLTDNIVLASRELYVVPMLSAVNTQSVVTGSDANPYKCIQSHVASTDNQPVTGANWRLYWESGGTSPSTWATGTAYTAPQLLRLLYRRPIYDFDTASDTPDFPISWPRLMVYKFAYDLADYWGIPQERADRMIQKAKGAYDDLFVSARAKSTDLHHKASYF